MLLLLSKTILRIAFEYCSKHFKNNARANEHRRNNKAIFQHQQRRNAHEQQIHKYPDNQWQLAK